MRGSSALRTTLLLAGCLVAGCRFHGQNLPVTPGAPATIAVADYDVVWDATIAGIDRFFDIAYENRYDGRIETSPQTSPTLLELWRPDSPNLYERWLATNQSIRRRAFAQLRPAPTGGFLLTLEVYKELEDVGFAVYGDYGPGGLIASVEPLREAPITTPVAPTAGWISLGRDTELEAKIVARIHDMLSERSGLLR